MLVKIKKSDACPTTIAHAIFAKFAEAGYRATIEPQSRHVKISNVRRKAKGDYCGNHPGTCQFRPHFPSQRHRGTWLEGGDWLVADDIVNDVLDATNSIADVGTGGRSVNIRIGEFRRILYRSYELRSGVYEWNLFGELEDYGVFLLKAAPRAKAMTGTPGMSQDRAVPYSIGVSRPRLKIGTLRKDLKGLLDGGSDTQNRGPVAKTTGSLEPAACGF